MISHIIEKEFTFLGYKCVVIFNRLGIRCGYVGIPKENKIRTNGYDIDDFKVHGGVTYCCNGLPNGDYSDNIQDKKSYKKYFGNENDFSFGTRKKSFVIKECKMLARQLKEREEQICLYN